jgi:hypothetical protein
MTAANQPWTGKSCHSNAFPMDEVAIAVAMCRREAGPRRSADAAATD